MCQVNAIFTLSSSAALRVCVYLHIFNPCIFPVSAFAARKMQLNALTYSRKRIHRRHRKKHIRNCTWFIFSPVVYIHLLPPLPSRFLLNSKRTRDVSLLSTKRDIIFLNICYVRCARLMCVSCGCRLYSHMNFGIHEYKRSRGRHTSKPCIL